MAMNRKKAILAETQLTSKWLAQKLGKSENTVSRWCSNRAQASIGSFLEIADTLDVDVRELLSPSQL
ncbi:helix-turn-helix transcriptional regulator [Porphyromonas catoniae]